MGLHVILEIPYLITTNYYKLKFFHDTEIIFTDIFLRKSKPVLEGVFYRPPGKSDSIEYPHNYLKRSKFLIFWNVN